MLRRATVARLGAARPDDRFSVNATGTLAQFDTTRRFAHGACFIFASTKKVYGDSPRLPPPKECETQWELDAARPYAKHRIDENTPALRLLRGPLDLGNQLKDGSLFLDLANSPGEFRNAIKKKEQ